MADEKKQDAIALIKADHRKVEELFSQFEGAKDGSAKKKLADRICQELIVHTILEEEIFYPAFEGRVEKDLLDEAYVEHDGAKVMIAEILAMVPDAEFYDAKVKVLSEEIEHHVQEEEEPGKGILFQARETGDDMMALGEALRARKQAALEEIEANGLPTPETRTFVGAEVKTGAPVE